MARGVASFYLASSIFDKTMVTVDISSSTLVKRRGLKRWANATVST
jgi:hypothetical protein